MDEEYSIEIINGVEGNSISLNGYRLCGSKPWGGGNIKNSWKISIEDLIEAIPELTRKSAMKSEKKEFQGITITKGSPRIITLCGSSRFCGQMAILAWEFEKGGCIALGLHLLPQGYCEEKGMKPDKEGNIHHIGEQEGVEDIMDSLHFKKIEMSDSIFVVNVGGYIGKSTKREIEYAQHLGKPISYLEE